jgi:hypothetical protein
MAIVGFDFGQKEQQSGTTETQRSFVDPLQQSFLAQLFPAAANLAFGQQPAISLAANELQPGLLTAGQQFIEGLQTGAGGPAAGTQSAIQGLLGIGQAGGGLPGNQLISGAGASAQALLGVNPGLAPAISFLQDMIQNNLQATAGTIAGQATLGGSTGGSRQALATGLASQEATRQFAGGAAGLISQDFAARQQLAPQLVGQQIQAGALLNQGALGLTANQLQAFESAGGLATDAQTGQTAAAAVGIPALQGIFDLGLAPFAAEFNPLLALASILGTPSTVIGEGQRDSFGRTDEISGGLSFG